MYDEHESIEQSLPAELAALEKQLAAFAPMAPRVDRDRLMFAAGRASVGHSTGTSWAGSKFWPAATVLATAASILLATMLVWQRAESGSIATPQVAGKSNAEPIVVQDASWRWSDRLPSGYLGVRHVALTRGVGALEYELPAVDRGETELWSPPATAGQLRKEFLPTPKHSSS